MGYGPAAAAVGGGTAARAARPDGRAAHRHGLDGRADHRRRHRRLRRPGQSHRATALRQLLQGAGAHRVRALRAARASSPTCCCSALQRLLTPWTRTPSHTDEARPPRGGRRDGEGGLSLHGTRSADAWTWLTTGANWQGRSGVWHRLAEHLYLSGVRLAVACADRPAARAVPRPHRARAARSRSTSPTSAARCPTFAVLVLLMLTPAAASTGTLPTVIALVLFAVPPLLTNAYVGMREVDRSVVEAARGMGMSRRPAVRPGRAAARLPADHDRHPVRRRAGRRHGHARRDGRAAAAWAGSSPPASTPTTPPQVVAGARARRRCSRCWWRASSWWPDRLLDPMRRGAAGGQRQ